jgi:hypothetical protein
VKAIVFALSVVWLLIALGAWLSMMVHLVLVMRSSRDKWNPWSRTAYRTHPLMHPELLTPEGRRYRRRLGFTAAFFVAWIAASMVVLSVLEGLGYH